MAEITEGTLAACASRVTATRRKRHGATRVKAGILRVRFFPEGGWAGGGKKKKGIPSLAPCNLSSKWRKGTLSTRSFWPRSLGIHDIQFDDCVYFSNGLVKNHQLENGITPPKINIEPENDGLVQMIFLLNWVNFRFYLNLLGFNGKCKRIYKYQLINPTKTPQVKDFFLWEKHTFPRSFWDGFNTQKPSP